MIRPRGTTLLEILVASVLVAALTTLTIQSVTAIGRQQRTAWQRTVALQVAANEMEAIAEHPWSELEPGTSTIEQAQSESTIATLPDFELTRSIELDSADPTAKRIEIAVRWTSKMGETARPVRLIAWVYQMQDAEPAP